MSAVWTAISSADTIVAHYASDDFRKTWDAQWLTPKWGWKAWGIGLAIITLIFVLEYSLKKIKEVSEKIEGTKPEINLKNPGAIYIEPILQQFTDKHGNILREQTVPFLKVRFFNDPTDSNPSGIAKDVRAYIDYYRLKDDAHVLSIDGRWAESDQPPTYSPFASKAHLLGISFGIGEARSLDVAYCDPTSGKYYAWNNDNYAFINQFYVNPKHLLEAEGLRVEVRLRGEWVDKRLIFTFKTENRGFNIDQDSCRFC